MRLIGVDGCRAGWVVAESSLPADGSVSLPPPTFRIEQTFGGLLAALAETQAMICVDIPIGLPSGHSQPHDDGRRLADLAARAFLGGYRASSIFSAPCRPTLASQTYRDSCASEMKARGKKLSRQAFGIIPKIREVDDAISPCHQQSPDGSARVLIREVHPEVSFAMLRGHGERGHGLVASKRGRPPARGAATPGETERLALLRPYIADLDLTCIRRDLIQRHRAFQRERSEPASGPVVGRDDIVDAAACLVTAFRVARDHAVTFPDGPAQTDARGLRMEIVA